MSIKRYTAYKDNTITNAFKTDLIKRGTGSNMGAADSLEVFSIYGQQSAESNEQSKILIQFPVSSSDTGTTILADRTSGKIPVSGNVNFFLKMFNVVHDQTVPRDFTLVVSPISQSWQEGSGLDMEQYSDETYNGTGSNWINAEASTVWTNIDGITQEGGSFLSASWNGALGQISAAGTIVFNSNTAADYDGETFTLKSTDATEVVYTLDDDTGTNTYGASTTNIGIQGGPSALWIAGRVQDAITNASNAHNGKLTVARDAAAAATATIQFNSNTAADYDGETFTIESTDGTSVVYTLDDDTTSNTYGASTTNIGIQGAPAASKVSELVTTAGNHSSNAHANKITFVEGASATVTLTQDVSGQPGNNTITTSDSTDITVSGFTGGTGTELTLTQVVGGAGGNNTITTDSSDITVSGFTGGAPTTPYDEFNYKKSFDTGVEDLEVDITGLVEQWIIGTTSTGYENYGIGVSLTASQISGSNRSYYTKKFSARGSEFFFKRPVIEARWDSSRKDHRGSFYVSSSVLNTADNLNTIYFYNYVRGQAKNVEIIGINDPIYVTIHTSRSAGEKIAAVGSASLTYTTAITGGYVTTGTYSASFALDTSASVVYDRWFSGSVYYHTGSFEPISLTPSNMFDTTEYITSITNLRSEYLNNDIARLRLYTRERNWNPTIYTVATTNIENSIIDDAYFKVFRIIDDEDVISYGTGSVNHTRLSYDVSGSYFDLDMSLLEAGYEYGIKFVFYTNGSYDEHNATFKFKVVE